MDFVSKRQIIENINDEVKILHPLLNHLLRQLPSVTRVEYRHGPNEKGADFIVCRDDPTLSRPTYIGVIAKVGRILSNFDDIARQVEECQMLRTYLGGKTEIRLSEVWVINTASISNNAQEKILEKYRAQSIQFIPGEDLTQLVDKYAPYFWHDIPTSIGSYLQNLSSKLERLDNDLNIVKGLGCDNFYIDPDIQEFELTKYVKNKRASKRRNVNLLDEVVREKASILEAEMGFGKSKAARHIAMHFCSPQRFNHNPILPLFGQFSDIVKDKITLKDFFTAETKKYFSELEIPKCEILFVIDGVDEAAGKYEEWDEHLQTIIKEAKSTDKYHLLLTSRPLKRLDETVSLFAGSKRYALRPLSVQKLVAFVTKACEKLSISKKVFEDLQRSDLFKQLPQSPIAAALLSRLVAQNTNDLPSNLTELYSKSIENLLGRWDIEKGGCTEKEFKDAEQATWLIAEYLVNNQLIYMSESEAREIVRNWHSKRNTNTPVDALEDRIFNKSGIFSVDNDSGTVAFSHRSFGEYLYAQKCVKQHKLIKPENSFNPYWLYIQFFQTGLLGDCEEHLVELLNYQPENEFASWLKILVMPDYFLAGYQTEYHVVEDNLYKLFIEAAQLFLQISKGESKTKLTELPEMHLLWFFQRIIRGAFSYSYFKKSMSSTILRIDEELIDVDVKYYALFFAACTAAEFEDGSGFEYLVKNYGANKLPITISLAIQLEQDTNKDFSKLALLKDHEKKLNALIKQDDSDKMKSFIAHRSIDDLFTKPVKTKYK